MLPPCRHRLHADGSCMQGGRLLLMKDCTERLQAGVAGAQLVPVQVQDSAVLTAAALAPHVGGAEVVNELYGYMNLLGIQGIGLVEATQRAPIIGHIIGMQPACSICSCSPWSRSTG